MDVTYNFTAGTRAVAQQVNQNFADVKSAVDPLETAVAEIQDELTGGFVLPDGSVDFTRLQSYATYTVSNATNATPIVITAVAHPFSTGDKVFISGVGGNTAANGTFTITKLGADTFSLDDSVGNGAFSSNGTAIIVPVDAGNLINKAYLDANAGALKINDLGTVSSNITLDTNKVTTADITGAVAIALPTTVVANNENIVVFDFTTGSTSQPTITSSRDLTGTCAVTNDDATVTGSGTSFTTELEVGSKITIATVDYQVLSIASDTSLELTANYAGTNASGLTVAHKFIKWSSNNSGKAPAAYSIISGVRNVLVFKTHDGGVTWEVEYKTFGGVETTFTQPVLSANGTLGGSNFAVYSPNEYNGNYAYRTFDNNNSTDWDANATSTYITFYNPNALKLSSINYISTAYGGGGYNPVSWTIYGSNDNSTWTSLTSNTSGRVGANVTVPTEIPLANRDFYKYYKFNIASTLDGNILLAGFVLTGVYIAT